MDETFALLRKGGKIVIETTFEVMEVNHKTMTVTLRNVRTGEVIKPSDWWFQNMRNDGFTVSLLE